MNASIAFRRHLWAIADIDMVGAIANSDMMGASQGKENLPSFFKGSKITRRLVLPCKRLAVKGVDEG